MSCTYLHSCYGIHAVSIKSQISEKIGQNIAQTLFAKNNTKLFPWKKVTQ
jgi:hypothetical protein